MVQNFSNKHIPEQGRGSVNPWWPFKSDQVSIEWLPVLLGLQPLTDTAYSLRVQRVQRVQRVLCTQASYFRQASLLIRATVRFNTLDTTTGAFHITPTRKEVCA
jgi:hypothetical protein